MDLKEFIKNFIDQFEDADVSKVTEEVAFREMEDWSSITALGVIGMVDVEYGVEITGEDIKKCTTIRDIYNLVLSRMDK